MKTINSYAHKAFKDITPLSNLQSFIKGTSSYLTNNLNLKAISKFITDGPANISYLANQAKKAVGNAKNVIVSTVKNVVKKTANTIKAITQKSYNTVVNAIMELKRHFQELEIIFIVVSKICIIKVKMLLIKFIMVSKVCIIKVKMLLLRVIRKLQA
ncbi:hypothetical protein [Methanobrevibacter curvatus]|uniref:Uncharacterized protein n=1 Tax=Methanobrevibacter curvatus TaxID=49547 RepID=A0A162FAU9_9EURY|nr:hypothetical protein [Methanobrevibacter curvatus]KZX10385.1 hypothetical protein MBCUR_18090 [Methanobrevibacter curvatus]